MPTIGEVYNPIIEAALRGDREEGERLLSEAGKYGKENLDYYCQYFSAETARKVKQFYGLGKGYRTLFGQKL